MNRNELKEIVKECLVEIMMEGLDSKKSISETSTRKVEQQKQPKKHHLDSVEFNSSPRSARPAPKPPQVPDDLVNSFPKSQRGIMNDIFEDTARTTLQTQVKAEKNIKAGMDPATTSGVDPLNIFEGAANWADLAFSSSKVRSPNN
jgi:hypothetical protein